MLKPSENFKAKQKVNLTVINSISLHDEITDEKLGKGHKFVSRFIEPGMVYYKEFGDVLITKETLDKFIDTMVGCPVIINHKDITNDNVDDERVGVVSRVWYNPDDNFFYCEGIIWDKEAIDLVKKKGWNVSCSYDFQSDFESKTHNGKKIDCTFTDGNFLHLALVDNPRYERANIVVNSKTENEEKWITIKPNGQDAKGKHLLLKDGESPKEAIDRVYKKEDKKDDFEKENKSILDIIEKRNQQAKELKERGALKDIKEPKTFEEKQKEDLQMGELVDITEDYYNRASKEELQKEFKEVQKEFIKWKDKKNFPEYKNYKNKLLKIKEIYDKRFEKKSNNSIERKENTVMTALNELEKFVRNIVENACKNEEKEEVKEEMKVENEDKRKLIDEVAGMMKSAGCDDEVIRTAIAKMEKIGYEKSEAGSADNKCKNADEEEKEEKFEEEKEIAENKKAKNEEKEEEEIKLEEEVENKCHKAKNSMDEENTMDKAKNMVYNGNSEVKSTYISRADRIELGNNY